MKQDSPLFLEELEKFKMETKQVPASVLVLDALSQLHATVPCSFVGATHGTFWRRTCR